MFKAKEILVIGSQKDAIVKAQFEPFQYSKKHLSKSKSLNFSFSEISTIKAIVPVCLKTKSKYIFIIPFWGESPEVAKSAILKVREARSDLKIIFIDPWAQTVSSYFNLLPVVDRFLKRQKFKDLSDYFVKFSGGNSFTDYLSKIDGYEFNGWDVSSKVEPGLEKKIVAGWNLGTGVIFKKLCSRKELPKFEKNIDFFCRMSLGDQDKKEWYHEYRSRSIDASNALAKKFNCAISGGFKSVSLIPKKQYYKELKQSKIVFSPFGWGETCWRDFDAVCYGCLLIKPSMSHIETNPNIFEAYKSYVPIKWDFSDLEEKVDYYLNNPDEMAAIVNYAYKKYSSYFHDNLFSEQIAELIR